MNDEALQSYLNQDHVMSEAKENNISIFPGAKDP